MFVFDNFEVFYRSQPSTEAVFALFTALASRPRARSLRSISFEPGFDDMMRQPFASAESDRATIESLLSYTLPSLFPTSPSATHRRSRLLYFYR